MRDFTLHSQLYPCFHSCLHFQPIPRSTRTMKLYSSGDFHVRISESLKELKLPLMWKITLLSLSWYRENKWELAWGWIRFKLVLTICVKLKDQWQTLEHLNASCTSLKTNKARVTRASVRQERYIRQNLVSSSRRGEKTPHKEKTRDKDERRGEETGQN